MSFKSIALVGCGRMGGAMLTGWQRTLSGIDVSIIDPANADALSKTYANNNFESFKTVSEAQELSGHFDICVVAVKPQIIDPVCNSIQHIVGPDTVVISIAAGITLLKLSQHFGNNMPIIRTMPNTPGAIGKGLTVGIGNTKTTDSVKADVASLLEPLGTFIWIDDERHMDAVTAVSGSGPAYIFLLIEAMKEAARAEGIPEELCDVIARETVYGSGVLAHEEAQIPASTLRENVTSPGGTTAAALSILMENDRFQNLMKDAVHAAAERSRELAKS